MELMKIKIKEIEVSMAKRSWELAKRDLKDMKFDSTMGIEISKIQWKRANQLCKFWKYRYYLYQRRVNK